MFNLKLVNGTNRCLWCWCRALHARQRHLTQTLICLDTLKGLTMTHILEMGTNTACEGDTLSLHSFYTYHLRPARYSKCQHSKQSRQALISCLQLALSCQLPVNTWFWASWEKASKHRKDLEIKPATLSSEESMHRSRWRCTTRMYSSFSISFDFVDVRELSNGAKSTVRSW